MTRALAAAVLAALLSARAAADEVAVPLRIDVAHVRAMLIEQVFSDPGPSAAVWRDGTGCGWLTLRDPIVDIAGGRLRVESRGEAQIGTPLGDDRCLPLLTWSGSIEAFEEPGVDAGGRALTFRVVDSNIYDERRRKGLATGRLWDIVKAHVHPRLETLRIDMSRPFEELRAWLPLVLPGSQERIDGLVASMALREPRVEADAIAVTLAFTVTSMPTPPAAEPEPPATEEELQRWDAFLTFVTKAVARGASGEARQAVMDVLLDGRHDVLEALSAEASAATPDPVPGLFLRTWDRLGSLARSGAAGLPGESALRLMSFVAAGDALAALLRLGPSMDVELSADGLRRLVRILDPSTPGDPLDYEDDVDPELRALFGFGDPLPPPDISPDVDVDVLSWLVPSAVAAVDAGTVRRLNAWIPTAEDLDAYLRAVRELLADVREETLAKTSLREERFRPLFRELVFATAWQESCWRQFIRRGRTLVTLRSPVGSVGIMQVNERVWRGVYDRTGLRGDIAYNARAGSEILMHYLRDYAIAKGEHALPGGLGNLARATYAVYNGGPRHLTRYRIRGTRRSLAAIDAAFWEKFVAVQQGRELDVVRCWGFQTGAFVDHSTSVAKRIAREPHLTAREGARRAFARSIAVSCVDPHSP